MLQDLFWFKHLKSSELREINFQASFTVLFPNLQIDDMICRYVSDCLWDCFLIKE